MKQMNLVKKLALTLTTAAVISSNIALGGCVSNNKYQKLLSEISADIGVPVYEIVYLFPERNFGLEDRYVSLIVCSTTSKEANENHKDYRFTYKISKEDYEKVISVCENYEVIKYFRDKSRYDLIVKIRENYEPLEIVECYVLEDENDHRQHNILGSSECPHKFSDSARYINSAEKETENN